MDLSNEVVKLFIQEKYGYKKISKILNMPTRKVLYTLAENNITNAMILPSESIIKNIINDYNTLNTAKLGEKYHMAQDKICYILKINNIDICQKGYHLNQQFKVDHNFFSTIDTEKKAYWLGFLYADGYNNEKTYQIELTLKEEDFDMVELFKKDLNSCYKISKRQVNLNNKIFYSFRHIIYSKIMSKQLANLGCIQNKSLKLKFPKNIKYDLIHHFMRGYFDGDGCISGSKFILCGTQNFLDDYVEILRKNTFISDAGKIYPIGKNKEWQHASKKDLQFIYDFLYKDATRFLKRKKDKFIEQIAPLKK